MRYGVHFSATAKIAQVDIHQAELSVDENVEFPIHADLGEFLQQWQLAIQARSSSGDDHANRREWVKIIGNCPINSNARNSVTAQGRYGQLLPQAVIERLAEIIPATAICILDGNLSMQMAQRHLTARYPFRWLNAGSSGCMGIGTPYAIGAKMTCPSEPVIVITGDMAFGLNAMEIETAVRTDTHLIVIIINNHGSMGNPHDSLIHAEDNQDKAIEYQPDLAYEKLAMALGAEGEVVDCLSGVQTALENALNTARTCCINILVDASAGL